MNAPSLTQLLIGLFGFSGETKPQKEQSPADTGLCEKEENSTMVIRSDINGKTNGSKTASKWSDLIASQGVPLTHAARTAEEPERPVLFEQLGDGTPYRTTPTYGKLYPHRYFEYAVVTPEFAAELLKKNERNRPINYKHVGQLVADMVNDKFPTIHQPIAVDKNGVLVDGQHRLKAIVQSDMSQILAIAWNEPGIGGPIDRVHRRTPAQQYQIETGLPGKDLYSILAVLCELQTGVENPTKDQMDRTHDNFMEEVAWVIDAYKGKKRGFTAAVRAAFAYIYPLDREKVAEAYARLIDVNVLEGHPMRALHKRIENDAAKKVTHARAEMMNIVLRAVFGVIRGEKLTVIKVDPKMIDVIRNQRRALDLPA